jgi:hypothetical protein
MVELMFTTLPWPPSSSCGVACLTSSNAAVTLRWNAASSSAPVVSSKALGSAPPALLTTTSSRPSSATACSTTIGAWVRSRTS